MSRVRECFVCGTLLATSEKDRVEVRHPKVGLETSEVCRECWWKVRAAGVKKVSKKGLSFSVMVRRSQLQLFGETAAACIGRGRRHG